MDTTLTPTERLWAYLQLTRPANIVTALADIMAGFAASGAVLELAVPGEPGAMQSLMWLLVSTAGLYGGGVVFNDVFDATLDAEERPERPIPSGRVSRGGAAALGGVLLVAGVAAAAQVAWLSAVLAALVAAGAVVYDAYGKHHYLLGPLNMGACRGGNLLLGVSAVPVMVPRLWFLALLPIAYIAGITAISRGEVHGGSRRTGVLALTLIGAVLIGLLLLGVRTDYEVWMALPFALLLAWQVIPPFIKATRAPEPEPIKKAVKAGVLALIVMDAALAAGFAGWVYGLVVLLLLPVSIGLARLFAVT